MNGQDDILPYLRLMLNIHHPGLEECWIEGYTSAKAEQDEEDNPYQPSTSEYEHWLQGWWEGFYGNEAWREISSYHLENNDKHAMQIAQEKVSKLRRLSNNIRKKANCLIKISSVIAAMFLVSYQLYDFII